MPNPVEASVRRVTPRPGPSLDLTQDQSLGRAVKLAARSIGVGAAGVSRGAAVVIHVADGLAQGLAHRALAERVAAEAKPLAISDLREQPKLRDALVNQPNEPRAMLSTPLRASDGRVTGALCVFDVKPRKWKEADAELLRGISETLSADLELRDAMRSMAQRESELTELLDHTDELVFATSLDDRLTFVNASWCRALGFDAESAAGLVVSELVARGHRVRYEDTMRRVAEGKAMSDVEMVFKARNGRRVVCRGRITPRVQEGVVVGARHAYLDVTEARRAEAVRARLAATLEATTDFVGITTQDGGLVYLNGAGRRLIGLAPDADLASLALSTLRPPDEDARIRNIAIPAAVRDGVWDGDSLLLGPDGEEIPVSLVLVAHPSTWPGEPPYFISAVMRDLRERVSAERALRESEARKQAMLDTALDCVVTIDSTGRILEFNPAAETTFGYLREEALGNSLVELIIPEPMRETHQNAFDRYILSGDERMLNRLVQMPALRGDGSEFVCEFSITRLPIDGQPVFTAFMRDITARKELEQTLANEREFLVAVLENLTDGVVACDAAGRPTLVNRALRATLGLPDSATPPENWPPPGLMFASDGVTPLAPADTPLARAHRGDVVQDLELVVNQPSGEARNLLASGRRIVDFAGEPRGAVVALHDVTESRRAERLKSQLIRTVSHELRTPLTAVRGALDLLQRKAAMLGESERTLLAMASRNVAHLARMVNDLLDVERIESGAATMEQEWVDAAFLMDTAREITQTVADAAEVTVDVEAASLDVWGDPDRLTQVLTNLVGNAVKFSPRGTSVTLSARRFDDDTAICFTVADQGRGIPPEHLDSIFEPFEQVEAADSHDHAGSGLGLTICRAIVRQHGGTIWAESTPGEGSVFRFVLPTHFDMRAPS